MVRVPRDASRLPRDRDAVREVERVGRAEAAALRYQTWYVCCAPALITSPRIEIVASPASG
jgi:hypothetical protein